MASAIPTGGATRPPSALLALTELPRALAEWGSLSVAAGPLLGVGAAFLGHAVEAHQREARQLFRLRRTHAGQRAVPLGRDAARPRLAQ